MIPSGDLRLQYQTLKVELDRAIQSVLDKGWFVLGEQVAAFESDFAAYCGVRHAIGVGNGTDALRLALQASGIGAGDEVITAPNSATFTALAITDAGATPRFVDINPTTYNLDPALLDVAIGPRTKAIMPVHLYGQTADMRPILDIAQRHGLVVIEDAAQAHGARYLGKSAGALGTLGCFSFYPSKNLGGFGDGGMVVTDDDGLAETVRMLRNGGQASRYDHRLLGINSRLDEIQAAILRAKLPHLDAWNHRRRHIASLYTALLGDSDLELPVESANAEHVYHQYVVRSTDRDGLQKHLAEQGVQTVIHYPVPIHLQEAYRGLGIGPGSFPVAERYAGQVLSLPIYPELTDEKVRKVAHHVLERRS